jgi:hypothetical protein
MEGSNISKSINLTLGFADLVLILSSRPYLVVSSSRRLVVLSSRYPGGYLSVCRSLALKPLCTLGGHIHRQLVALDMVLALQYDLGVFPRRIREEANTPVSTASLVHRQVRVKDHPKLLKVRSEGNCVHAMGNSGDKEPDSFQWGGERRHEST